MLLLCFPENKTGPYINFCSKNALGLIFRGFSPHVQQSTFIQIQSCHLLLVAAQGWRASFHSTRTYFGGRACMTSIMKNRTRAYFQGNRMGVVPPTPRIHCTSFFHSIITTPPLFSIVDTPQHSLKKRTVFAGERIHTVRRSASCFLCFLL